MSRNFNNNINNNKNQQRGGNFQSFQPMQQPGSFQSQPNYGEFEVPYQGNSSGRPRTTSSWKKGGDKKRSFIAKTNVGSKIQLPDSVPQGQYLSKTSSEVSNDPLSEKAYFPGPSEEFRRIADRKKLYVGCEVLPILTEQTYTKAACLSPSYGKTVPRSAHDYYVAVLVYHRLLTLEKLNGRPLTYEETLFVDQINSSNFSVPKSVSLYMSGMGNTKAPKSRELEFKFHKPELTTEIVQVGDDDIIIPGYFGDITNHIGSYASYPCLGVYVQRMLEDLLKTQNHQRYDVWDLPETIRYHAHPINRNCLGYVPSKVLSAEQKAFFDNCNFRPTECEFSNSEIPINLEILSAVHVKLQYTKQTLYPLPETIIGSTGQLPIQEITEQLTSTAIKANFAGKTAFELPAAEGYLGCSFLYNVRKDYESIRLIKSLLPVNFRVNEAVPIDVRQSLNFNYSNNPSFIRERLYETVSFSPILRLEDVVKLDSKTDM